VPVDLVVTTQSDDHDGVKTRARDLTEARFKRTRSATKTLHEWAMQAFDTFRVGAPPESARAPVNLSISARGCTERRTLHPSTPWSGTDIHTMVNRPRRVAWGVGWIDAEAGIWTADLYPHSRCPSRAPEGPFAGVTATYLVLTFTD